MTDREKWMRRCFDLAELGRGKTGLNPVVGAVLVHNDKIIGEGCHKYFGGPHAEVEALRSVKPEYQNAVSQSTLYVSLEPCSHFGKTPPCSRLIIQNKIPEVVVSVMDPNPLVSGRGIQQLRDAGVKVQTGVLEADGRQLINRFLCNQKNRRPYVTLKYARSRDGFVGRTGERTPLSNSISNQLVHRMRCESDAIAVGRKTAEIDSPSLTSRNYPGTNPMRLIFSKSGINPLLKTLDKAAATVIVGQMNPEQKLPPNLSFLKGGDQLTSALEALYEKLKTGSLLVEGGPTLLKSFLEEGCWDEMYEIVCPVSLHHGDKAPDLSGHSPIESFNVSGDQWNRYVNNAGA